ncbi:hypothetical protein HDU93_007112 [Gonapodya sp. JEL0774]|nr:hypothetical protein HDU93_007112 [Gonapodya sp. JEL0774]
MSGALTKRIAPDPSSPFFVGGPSSFETQAQRERDRGCTAQARGFAGLLKKGLLFGTEDARHIERKEKVKKELCEAMSTQQKELQSRVRLARQRSTSLDTALLSSAGSSRMSFPFGAPPPSSGRFHSNLVESSDYQPVDHTEKLRQMGKDVLEQARSKKGDEKKANEEERELGRRNLEADQVLPGVSRKTAYDRTKRSGRVRRATWHESRTRISAEEELEYVASWETQVRDKERRKEEERLEDLKPTERYVNSVRGGGGDPISDPVSGRTKAVVPAIEKADKHPPETMKEIAKIQESYRRDLKQQMQENMNPVELLNEPTGTTIPLKPYHPISPSARTGRPRTDIAPPNPVQSLIHIHDRSTETSYNPFGREGGGAPLLMPRVSSGGVNDLDAKLGRGALRDRSPSDRDASRRVQDERRRQLDEVRRQCEELDIKAREEERALERLHVQRDPFVQAQPAPHSQAEWEKYGGKKARKRSASEPPVRQEIGLGERKDPRMDDPKRKVVDIDPKRRFDPDDAIAYHNDLEGQITENSTRRRREKEEDTRLANMVGSHPA